jgi:RimJ/RimL family protein N-acetyltransferase
LDPDFLRPFLAGRIQEAEAIIEARLVRELPVARWVLEHRLQMIEHDPSQQPWLLRAVVLKETSEVIGDVGFHQKPGGKELQKYSEFGLEMGYGIDPEFRRQGFATEAVKAMMCWAHREHGVESFFLSTSPENTPSLKLIQKLGFRMVGSQMDEIDGLELVFRGDAGTDLVWIGQQ